MFVHSDLSKKGMCVCFTKQTRSFQRYDSYHRLLTVADEFSVEEKASSETR